MPKRKRSEEETSSSRSKSHTQSLTKLLSTHHQKIHAALKTAKGHERQRQSKRLRDPQTDAAKRSRIQNEVIVLKSLDLNTIALTHLRSALLRIKSIAECEKLPEEVKAPVPKPDLTEDEEKALHNVTSCLFARPEVKKETERAIEAVGKALGVEVPEKKKGRVREKDLERLVRKDKGEENKKLDGEGDTTMKDAETDEPTTNSTKQRVEKDGDDKKRKRETAAGMNGGGDDSESESDVDEVADKEEQALAKLDELLGSSSEDEVDDEVIAAAKARNQGKMSVLGDLDPMEITSGEEDEADEYDDIEEDDPNSDGDSEDNDVSEGEDDDEGESESGSFQGFSDDDNEISQNSASESEAESEAESESSAVLSPPRKKKATSSSASSTPGGSTFLPTLMGGYISDSNSSASDLDIAPNSRKNRRGQRARQAIWEKKYKEQARHLREGGNNANKRDAGWDLKRGAVDPAAAGRPWKLGIKNPLLEKDKQKGGDGEAEKGGEEGGGNNGGRTLLNARVPGGKGKGKGKPGADRPLNRKERRALGIKTPVGPPGGGGFAGGGGGHGGGTSKGGPPAGMPPKKRDDEGPLHPSWEARKKAKAMLETAPFQGKKITFD